MTPAELARVKSLCARALTLPDGERETFLRQDLSDAPHLLEETTRLLGWHADASGFLQTPLAVRMIEPLARDLRILRLGAYELVRELGQGGSATVYLARRADDLFEKQVAIKVMSRLAHSEQLFRRFQREIQILARLEHPYIVRLLEAGTTGEALSFIVTEFIDGIRIDEFAAGLKAEEKLRLFLKVCEGVAAAHRALIVHRDLKPSNILVTPDGTPKILDFGIAVLLDRDTQHTRTVLERLTVCYASPEQLRGERPITTSSDIYSLGVLLYEMVCGRLPYDYPEHEMAARIAEEDPPPMRGAPRELEAITRKALREAAARYESVDRLRDDINRYLEGLPVEAEARGRAYRLRKYARKHWLLIAAPAAVIVLLVAFSIVSLISLREARRQSARLRELLVQSLPNMIDGPDHWVSLRTRHLMEMARLPYLDALAAEYPRDWAIRNARFEAYRVVGNLEGLPSSLNLGDTDGARRTLESAVRIGEEMLRQERCPAEFPRDVAVAHLELGTVLLEMNAVEVAQRQFARAEELVGDERVNFEARAQQSRILVLRGEREEALKLRRQVVEERRPLYERDPAAMSWPFGGALCSYGELQREMSRLAAAEKSYEEALPILESAAGEKQPLSDRWNLAREHEEYGRVLLALGRWPEARQHLNRAIQSYRAIRGRDPDAMSNQRALASCLAIVSLEMGKRGEGKAARELLREALQLSKVAALRDPKSQKAQAEYATIQAFHERARTLESR